MSNIAILKTKWKEEEESYLENLKTYAKPGTNFTPVYYSDDVIIKISNESTEILLKDKSVEEFDTVYFNTIKKKKDVAIAVAKYALSKNIRVIPEYINEGID